MNYKLITNETMLVKFIEWLPELKPDEIYVVNLFARNKYCKGIVYINSDKAQMKRFASDKRWLLRKIKQLETEIGTYWQQDIQIPQEALALYITINPRSQVKAAKGLAKFLIDRITEPYNNYNVIAEATSQLQKAVSRKIYFDLDFDYSEEELSFVERTGFDLTNDLSGILNPEAYRILRTKNGYHALVELNMIDSKYSKTWYNQACLLPGVDIKGTNSLLPIPGTSQGGFTPYFI